MSSDHPVRDTIIAVGKVAAGSIALFGGLVLLMFF